jgi:hypothetical protein
MKSSPKQTLGTPQHLNIPAIFTTQVNLMVSDDGWRLTFGEPTSEDGAKYHSAVFLPMRTALQLIDLLNTQKAKGGSQ